MTPLRWPLIRFDSSIGAVSPMLLLEDDELETHGIACASTVATRDRVVCVGEKVPKITSKLVRLCRHSLRRLPLCPSGGRFFDSQHRCLAPWMRRMTGTPSPSRRARRGHRPVQEP